jgi:hypothetical protein
MRKIIGVNGPVELAVTFVKPISLQQNLCFISRFLHIPNAFSAKCPVSGQSVANLRVVFFMSAALIPRLFCQFCRENEIQVFQFNEHLFDSKIPRK